MNRAWVSASGGRHKQAIAWVVGALTVLLLISVPEIAMQDTEQVTAQMVTNNALKQDLESWCVRAIRRPGGRLEPFGQATSR